MEELDDENTPLPVEMPLPPTPVDPSSEEPILESSMLPPPSPPNLHQTVYRISFRHSLTTGVKFLAESVFVFAISYRPSLYLTCCRTKVCKNSVNNIGKTLYNKLPNNLKSIDNILHFGGKKPKFFLLQ